MSNNQVVYKNDILISRINQFSNYVTLYIRIKSAFEIECNLSYGGYRLIYMFRFFGLTNNKYYY